MCSATADVNYTVHPGKCVLATRVTASRCVRGFKLSPAIEFDERRKVEGPWFTRCPYFAYKPLHNKDTLHI